MGYSIQTTRYNQSVPFWFDDDTVGFSFEQVSEGTYFFGVDLDIKRYVEAEDGTHYLPEDAPLEHAQSGFYLSGSDLALNEAGDGVLGDISGFQYASIMFYDTDLSDLLYNFDLGNEAVTFESLVQGYDDPTDFLISAVTKQLLDDAWGDGLSKLTITGTDSDDFIDNYFVDQRVILEGLDGDDELSLYGAYGRIDGGDGRDTLHGYGADDAKYSSLADSETLSQLQGGQGQDTIYYYYGMNAINGQEGADTIIFAGENTDADDIEATIAGKQGADYIEAGGDKVTINGNGGKDTLVLGAELSVVKGGKAEDTFEFALDLDGLIRIRDFEIGIDVLNTNGALSLETFEENASQTNNGHVNFVLDDLQVVLLNTDLTTLLESDFLM